MGLKQVFVHRAIIDKNDETGESDRVFTVKDSEGIEHRSSVVFFLGPSELKYDRDGDVGMRVWIETFDKVVLRDGVDAETGELLVSVV